MTGDDGLRAFVLGLVDRPGVPPAVARELADSIAAWHEEEVAALRAKAAAANRVRELADQLDAEAEHCDVRVQTYPPSGPWALEHAKLTTRARISRRAAARLRAALDGDAPC